MKPFKLIFALAGAGCLLAQNPAPQQPDFSKVEVHILPVQGNVYLLLGSGGNITVQVGKDGVLLVDTEYAELAPKIMATIRTVSKGPVSWIVDTHVHPDHSGGNAALAKLGATPDSTGPARIVAHENVLNRMTAAQPNKQPPVPQELWPNDEYFLPAKEIFFNGEAVQVMHEPNAHTDGDSIVFFRRSDVVSTGDIFTPGRYPFIDLQRGGSVQGLIKALNHILEITIPGKYQEGGTQVIPGHGRLCEENDVQEYRDMVTIVRDRVQDMIKKGKSLEEIKASKPTLDYDTAYGAAGADRFIEAVYTSLKNPPQGLSK